MFASLVKFVGTSLKWTFIVLLVLVAGLDAERHLVFLKAA